MTTVIIETPIKPQPPDTANGNANALPSNQPHNHRSTTMTLEQIKAALSNGLIVCWKNNDYQVNQDKIGQYLITHRTGNTIGLTQQDGTTLNGQPEDFYTLRKPTLTATTGAAQ